MASRSSLRASDADREAVAERLRHAAVEGRLEPDELEERLHVALRARTYGDLRQVLADLPATSMAWERSAAAMPAARTALVVAMRVAMTLAVVAVVLVVAAVMAAWWILWAVVWLAVCGRRSCTARLGARPPWDRAPRARGVRRGRLAG